MHIILLIWTSPSFFWSIFSYFSNQSVTEFPNPEELLDITNIVFSARLSAVSLQIREINLKEIRVHGSTQHTDVIEDPL